ncbi:IPTL-CTERM sorting domain-containing protein [Rhodoferax sp.]|nr:IPTL-CTERM sorting domain-containing protein [Rhodoferax sp.]
MPATAGAVASIPTLSEWGMILMSGLLMLLGMARLRRPQ